LWKEEGVPSEIKINSAGFRDYERSKNKPENGLRIALLENSYTGVLQVKLEDTYGAIMEEKLQRCPVLKNQKVEVINFGISGHSTAQELMTLRHHVWDYSHFNKELRQVFFAITRGWCRKSFPSLFEMTTSTRFSHISFLCR
jgi:hypothetical protein